MKDLLRKIFSKSEDQKFYLDNSKPYRFVLKIDDLEMAYLESKDDEWIFRYTEDFRNQDTYRRLTGFSDLSKEYRASELWPFFKIRIPGLKQPMIQEIIERENIDKNSEAQLLKRFGARSTTNPYLLIAS
ncbi:HipA N-terminal domain-containing protein [Marinoscillum sp.]|uniref:HipA N-terminal domain-containing protein n=1 Tax=Marinoscillum sp. TaxID=2024838 RepID=UPI003BA90936